MSNRSDAGERVRMLRERAGLSQAELGNKAGINPNSISNWELGIAYPQYSGIKRLCRALNCSADELLGRPLVGLNESDSALLVKIRQLDEDGLHTVEAVLESQLRRLGRL